MEQTIATPERPVSQLSEIFRYQIACALRELEGCDDEVPASVHGARKHLKKARATLRSLRPSVGEEIYRRENIVVRDAARRLSAARDAEVLLVTFEKLTKQVQPQDNLGLLPLRRALNRHVRALARSRSADLEHIGQLRKALSSAGRRASRWTLRGDDWQHVRLGLLRTYRTGRAEAAAARRAPTTERLHDWRKRAKYLWHQLQMFAPIAPGELGERADQFHNLSDYLGEEHDLAVLEETASALELDMPPETRARFTHAVEERRSQLREKAFALGERLYEAKAGRFADRLDRLWNEWQDATTNRQKPAEARSERTAHEAR